MHADINNLYILNPKNLRSSASKMGFPILLNYLKATDIEVGLLLNFGTKPEVKRKAFDNLRKQFPARHRELRRGGRVCVLIEFNGFRDCIVIVLNNPK